MKKKWASSTISKPVAETADNDDCSGLVTSSQVVKVVSQSKYNAMVNLQALSIHSRLWNCLPEEIKKFVIGMVLRSELSWK